MLSAVCDVLCLRSPGPSRHADDTSRDEELNVAAESYLLDIRTLAAVDFEGLKTEERSVLKDGGFDALGELGTTGML